MMARSLENGLLNAPYPQDVGPIETSVFWQSYNAKKQNKLLNSISERQDQQL